MVLRIFADVEGNWSEKLLRGKMMASKGNIGLSMRSMRFAASSSGPAHLDHVLKHVYFRVYGCRCLNESVSPRPSRARCEFRSTRVLPGLSVSDMDSSSWVIAT